ncbi:MAG: tyrosine-type recombinase/integrase [Prolixibacteraceae bacterium]|nr:tyrosine-type recombinase/integrase [Prolixibacteraceae bacterium]
MIDKAVKLPSIKREKRLPVMLNRSECRALFKAPELLKHRVLLSLMYPAGLRAGEVSRLELKDIDSERMMIHILPTNEVLKSN